MIRKKEVRQEVESIVDRHKRDSLKQQGQNMQDYDIAYDFSTKVYKQFRELIKSIVLFGSVVKGEGKRASDLDIIIIVDDATVKWDDTMTAWYRTELAKIVDSHSYPRKLHVNTVTLTTFWQEVMAGEPLVINVLRYGVALIDFGGFFEPLKVLLARGRIRPSREAIFTALNRAPVHLTRARYNVLMSVEALYWAMVDSSHAALMAAGVTPPSPEHIPDLLHDAFVKKDHLNRKYVRWYYDLYALAHKISRGETSRIDARILYDWQEKTDKYIGVMARLVRKFEIDAPHPGRD